MWHYINVDAMIKPKLFIYPCMKKWTSDDYAYAMDSDVISHGYETDLETEEHQNYDISGVSLNLYTEKKIP